MNKSILVFLVVIIFYSDRSHSIKQCETSSKWSLSQKLFPKDFPAKLKLIAFMKATCGFCQSQSIQLAHLYRNLTSEKYNVSFIIINDWDQAKKIHLLTKSNLTVLQNVQKRDVWKKYDAEIDDMILFDECNRMVKYLKAPESHVHTGSVKNEILSVYNSEICGDSSCKPKRRKASSN